MATAAPKTSARETLIETVYSDSPKVNREAGVVSGVRILGASSKNGREYSEAAMQQAATIYEGLGVNVNHPDRKQASMERGVGDGIGWLSGVKYIPEQKAVVGDLNILKEHPLAGLLFEAAERNPKRFGLSHNAEGRMGTKGGKRVVESIESVRSVDIVQTPATNTGLFESEEPMKKLREHVEQIDKANPGRAMLLKLLEEDGMAPMAMAEMPAEASGGESEDQVKAAFRQMVVAAFDDDKLDTKATLTKIKDILKAYEKLNGGGETSSDKPSGAGESGASGNPMEESVKAKRAVATELLEAAGIAKPTESQVKAVARAEDSAERKELIESFKAKAGAALVAGGNSGAGSKGNESRFGLGSRPAVSRPLLESKDVEKYPADAKGFAAAVKR
jgi:hypothetical protein